MIAKWLFEIGEPTQPNSERDGSMAFKKSPLPPTPLFPLPLILHKEEKEEEEKKKETNWHVHIENW